MAVIFKDFQLHQQRACFRQSVMKSRLKSNWVAFSLTGFFLGVSGLAQAQGMPTPIDFGPKEKLSVVTDDTSHVFEVEVADSPEERARGMMFRDVLPNSQGMLFEFPEQQIASIWMKNTSVFLDVLFVRADGTILKIEHSAQPYSLRSMTSEAPVAAVLELAGGQALALGIEPGDKVEHEFFNGTAN